MMNDVWSVSLASGASLENVKSATQGLLTSMHDFNTMSPKTQEQLVKTTTQMEVLGVEAGLSANILDQLTNSLGINAKQAGKTLKDVASIGSNLGVGPRKMSEDFSRALPDLVRWGDKSIEVFKGLAAQAKATGIEISSLISLSKGFDTFSDATTKAAQLNAMLGKGALLNSISLLGATADQRIRMIKDAFDAAGTSIESLNDQERLAYASILNVPVQEFVSLMQTSNEEIEKNQRMADLAADSTLSWSKRIQAAVPATQHFSNMIQRMGELALPLLQIVNEMIAYILDLDESMGGRLIPTVTALAVLISGILAGKLLLGIAVGFTVIAAKVILVTALLGGLIYLIAKLTGQWDNLKSGFENSKLGQALTGGGGFSSNFGETKEFSNIENFEGGDLINNLASSGFNLKEAGSARSSSVYERQERIMTSRDREVSKTTDSRSPSPMVANLTLELDKRQLGKAVVDFSNDYSAINKV